MINIEDFIKVEIRVGKVLSAERVEGSEKLLKLTVDVGEETPRQILSGVAKAVTPEYISGKQVPIITNLAPRMMMGMESNGMMLCADNGEKPILLSPHEEVPPGSIVK